MKDETVIANRRPLKSRGSVWARRISGTLIRAGASPDAISIAGIGFALIGAWAFTSAPDHPWFYLLAAAGIQLRLLCNLLDGMVAIEGGRKSVYGPLYNEVPDRAQDSLLLIGAGFAAGAAWLGLLAALLAAVTAYIRMLGGSLGFAQDFRGPMAKPHRMAALTIGALAALVEALVWRTGAVMTIALWAIILGTAWTAARRIAGIAADLRKQG